MPWTPVGKEARSSLTSYINTYRISLVLNEHPFGKNQELGEKCRGEFHFGLLLLSHVLTEYSFYRVIGTQDWFPAVKRLNTV